MNFFAVFKLLGLLLGAFGASMIPAMMWSLYLRDGAWWIFLVSLLTIGTVGGGLFFIGRLHRQEIFRREATAIVGLGWLLSAAAGALPYYFARLPEMPTFADCYFESMSGLTTTGASVLTDIEAVAPGLLFWRSWTHWLGGLGIIMLFVAVLPYLGAGGRALVKSEVTGPVKEGLTPRIKDTALLLIQVYLGLTVIQTLLLWAVGMNMFDAMCHTFGTMATGGFSTKNTSIAAFGSFGIELIVIVFMVLAGTNFALMHTVVQGRPLKLLRDPEWRAYLGLMIGCALLIALLLFRWGGYDTHVAANRDAFFTVVSLMTTTGYVTADFEQWPLAAKWILMALMFVGGCAGSTGGGLKVVRWIILVKIAGLTLERIYRPRTIRKLKIGGTPVSHDIQRATLALFLLWIMLLVGGTISISLIEQDAIENLITPLSTVASTLNNIGPGFRQIGATENYAFLSPPSKWILSLMMALGRLELYSILVLFLPGFWRRR